MIGATITMKDGNPIDSGGQKLSESNYQPASEVMDLFSRVQKDYLLAWRLQHRTWDEFDSLSLLQRTRLDQQTFAAFVGAEYVPQHKKWRWKGRKNTARNKLIGILAHMLSGMLFPFVQATNEQNEEDKMTARVMRILVENHLKKGGYELKFLYMVTSALVNPAVIIGVEYNEAIQRIKNKLADGKIELLEAVDEFLSGVQLNIIPIDEFLIADFYTGEIQKQPYIIRVRRIPWDTARKLYSGKYKDIDGTDMFDYVQAGKTRILLAGQEHQTLYDIEWTEADRNYVQEITAYYRDEDLEVTFVGGVFMGEPKDIYNSNPFKHRRMSLIGEKWINIPIYPFAKSGFEPLDPYGRFFYYKSGAFKEYWDDASQNEMHRILHDGTYLDVIKPIFMAGVAKVDGTVIVPGATIGMPQGATATPYQLGPNLAAAIQAMNIQKEDMSESTQDKIMSGVTEKGVTAYAVSKAEQNARVFLGVFGVMVADLIRQLGELTCDCIIQHTTVGEIDATIPEALKLKFKTILVKGKEGGKDVTNQIRFTDKNMGREMSQEDIRKREWELYDMAGGYESDQRIYEVNPYKFARNKFAIHIDPDVITLKSMGVDRQQKELQFNKMTSQFVYPFVDPKELANSIIEEYSEGDPDKFKAKGAPDQNLLSSIFGKPIAGVGAGGITSNQNQNVA